MSAEASGSSFSEETIWFPPLDVDPADWDRDGEAILARLDTEAREELDVGDCSDRPESALEMVASLSEIFGGGRYREPGFPLSLTRRVESLDEGRWILRDCPGEEHAFVKMDDIFLAQRSEHVSGLRWVKTLHRSTDRVREFPFRLSRDIPAHVEAFFDAVLDAGGGFLCENSGTLYVQFPLASDFWTEVDAFVAAERLRNRVCGLS